MAARKRNASRTAAAMLVALAAFLGAAATAIGLPPFSTAARTSPGSAAQAELFGLATACHPTFDRVVIRARFGVPRYDVRYVKQVFGDASGKVVPLLGTRRIRIFMPGTRGHTTAGANLLPAVLTPLCPNLRQIKLAGDFEGYVTVGLGLRRRTGFRVFRLSGPTRIVVDVAH